MTSLQLQFAFSNSQLLWANRAWHLNIVLLHRYKINHSNMKYNIHSKPAAHSRPLSKFTFSFNIGGYCKNPAPPFPVQKAVQSMDFSWANPRIGMKTKVVQSMDQSTDWNTPSAPDTEK